MAESSPRKTPEFEWAILAPHGTSRLSVEVLGNFVAIELPNSDKFLARFA